MSEQSPTQLANRMRERGETGARFEGAYEGNVKLLEQGGDKLLEQPYSPSLSKTPNMIHKVIELSQEEGDK